MKKFIAASAVFGLFAVAGPAWAVPTFGLYTLLPTGQTLTLPDVAADSSPAIVPLGSAVDPESGRIVEGYAFIHYRQAPANKPDHNPGGKGGKGGGETCFAYLAKGAAWKTAEPWVMNGENVEGLDPAGLFGIQSAALNKWEDAADGIVGNNAGAQIFGAGAMTTTALVADTVSPDGQNEVYFGDVDATGAIAATIVWGVFSGPPSARQLVEWDQVYDQVDFDWSAGAEGVPGKMDFDNIVTHEDGHAAGMGHPSDSCTEETMYRFASPGEIKKRDLYTGDIAGINGLY